MNSRIVPYALLLLLASTAPAYAQTRGQPMLATFVILPMILSMIAIQPLRYIWPYRYKKPASTAQWVGVVLASGFLILLATAYTMLLLTTVYTRYTTHLELINIYVVSPILFCFLADWSLKIQNKSRLYIRRPKSFLLIFAASILNIFSFVVIHLIVSALVGGTFLVFVLYLAGH